MNPTDQVTTQLPSSNAVQRLTNRLLRGVTAVVDTNVLIDIRSCADLVTEYENGPDGIAAAQTPQAVFRRARARESLILAWYFQKIGAATASLPEEALAVLQHVASPTSLTDFGTHFTTWYVHFIKEYLLDRWQDGVVLGLESGLKGTDCDDSLVELCRTSRVPLVTDEGYSAAGGSESNGRPLSLARADVVETTSSPLRAIFIEDLTALNSQLRPARIG